MKLVSSTVVHIVIGKLFNFISPLSTDRSVKVTPVFTKLLSVE